MLGIAWVVLAMALKTLSLCSSLPYGKEVVHSALYQVEKVGVNDGLILVER